MSHSKFRIGLVNFWRRNLERLFLEANLLTYVISIMFPFLQLILVKSLSGWFILMIFNSSIIISLRNFQDKSFPPLVLSRTLKNNFILHQLETKLCCDLSVMIFSSSSVNTLDFLPLPVYFLSAFTRSLNVLLAMLNFLEASDNVLHSPLKNKIVRNRKFNQTENSPHHFRYCRLIQDLLLYFLIIFYFVGGERVGDQTACQLS